MRITRILLSLALICGPFRADVQAQESACSSAGVSGLQVIGDQTITVSTTALGLTVPLGTVCASLQVNTTAESIRWRSGAVPTTSVGWVLLANTPITVGSNDLRRFQMIRDGSADVEVFVIYQGPPGQ